ncbi:MAG: hypothetical protein QXU54_00315 [Candidatus Micrarchaeia archaeon]
MQRIATFNSACEMPENSYGFKMMLADGASLKMVRRASFSTCGKHLPLIVMQRVGKLFKCSKMLDAAILSERLPEIMPQEHVPKSVPAAAVDSAARRILRSGCAWYIKPDRYFSRGEMVTRVERNGDSVHIQTYTASLELPCTRLAQYLLQLCIDVQENGGSELIMQKEVPHTREIRVLVQNDGGILVPKFMYAKRRHLIGCNVAHGAKVEEYYDPALGRIALGTLNLLIQGYARLGIVSKAELAKLFSIVAVDFMVSGNKYVFCEYNLGPGMEGVRLLAPDVARSLMKGYLSNIERCMREISECGEELFYARTLSGKPMPIASADSGPSAINSQ